MVLPKTILIGGAAAAVVLVGVGAYLLRDSGTNQGSQETSLLTDYQELLAEMKDSKTEANLSGSCDNPQKFAEQIQDLEDKLEALKKRKNNLANAEKETTETPTPGSEPLEMSDGDYSDRIPSLPEISEDSIEITPTPGSEPLEMSDGDYSDSVPSLPEISEDSIEITPTPGSEPLEMSDGDYSDSVPSLPEISEDSIEITPTPGSEPLEMSDGDYGDGVPSLPEISEDSIEITPTPGSEPLEMSDGDYNDSVPTLPEIQESNILTPLDEINRLEAEIISELNNLKSLCDKEEKEIISDSCESACKKYSDCAEYTEGVTKEDLKDAYDTCLEECRTWSKETVICINKKPIKNPIDCENLGFCALPEYGGGYER